MSVVVRKCSEDHLMCQASCGGLRICVLLMSDELDVDSPLTLKKLFNQFQSLCTTQVNMVDALNLRMNHFHCIL